IGVIDLLVVNLYPFEATAARTDCTDAEAIENIDVGGPAMLRAAAKNHEHTIVVVDHADYDAVLAALKDGEVSAAMRRELAIKAFSHTARYDAATGRIRWCRAGISSSRCAMERTRISAPLFTGRPSTYRQPSRMRCSSKVRSSLSTISSTPMPRIRRSKRSTPRPASS